METTKDSIQLGLVHRPLAAGLAVVVTALLFTSVPLAFTAGAAASAEAPAAWLVPAAVMAQSGT